MRQEVGNDRVGPDAQHDKIGREPSLQFILNESYCSHHGMADGCLVIVKIGLQLLKVNPSR